MELVTRPEADGDCSCVAAVVVSVVAATGSAGTNPIAEPEAASDCSTGGELLCYRTRLATAFAAGVVEGMAFSHRYISISNKMNKC